VRREVFLSSCRYWYRAILLCEIKFLNSGGCCCCCCWCCWMLKCWRYEILSWKICTAFWCRRSANCRLPVDLMIYLDLKRETRRLEAKEFSGGAWLVRIDRFPVNNVALMFPDRWLAESVRNWRFALGESLIGSLMGLWSPWGRNGISSVWTAWFCW